MSLQFCLIQGSVLVYHTNTFSFVLVFKMDKEVVWSASGDDLASLGLTEKGDILTLKSFCIPRNNVALVEVANLIKSTGTERISRKKQKLRRLGMKLVSVGWKFLDKDSGKYKYIWAEKGGGARNVHFNSNSIASDIITKMTELFYPNCKSSFGRQTEFSFCLGYFRGHIIEESSSEPFVLSTYIKVNILSKIRLYLLAKKKPRLGIMTVIAQSSLDRSSDSDSEGKFSLFMSPALSHVRSINGSWRKVKESLFLCFVKPSKNILIGGWYNVKCFFCKRIYFFANIRCCPNI